MPSIHSLGAIRTGVRSILADDANFYFGDWFAIDTFLVMQSPLGSALLQIVEPLAGAAIETRPAAPALHHAAPTQGVAYDGVTVIHASFTPQAAVTAAVSSVELVTNYIIDGTPFDGGPANANGQFDIVIRYTGDAAYIPYFEAAVARWTQIITADIADSFDEDGNPVDDLVIDATVDVIDGPGSGGRNILGQAGPDWVRLPSYLPVHGVMKFDSYDLSFMVGQGILDGVILHEMGHVLGIGTIWQLLGLRVGDASYYGFTGSHALAEYKAMSGNASATSVPVQPGSVGGSSGVHWSESVFQNELMTPSTGPGNVMPISRLTIASLADLGYTVDLAAAAPYSFPGPLGPGIVSINDVSITEGNSGTQVATFTVTRSGGNAAFSVSFSTSDGIPTGSDYVAKSGTLNFGAGVNSQTVSVIVNGDIAGESDETFFVNLFNATNGAAVSDAQGTATIVNDDAGPGTITIDDVYVVEGDNGTQIAIFTVARSGGDAAFSVNFATANGTATAGSDYVASTGTLNFGVGERTRTISVVVNGDATIENHETFFVNLSGATNGAAIADHQGLGTIANDDSAGFISINDVSIVEGDGVSQVATFTVTRTGGTKAFVVHYATADGTANAGSDYETAVSDLLFAAGDNTRTVSVTINGDTLFENNEAFFVDLSGATNGATILDSQGQGTIVNDDSRSTLPDDFASSFTDLTAPFGQVSVDGFATGNLEVPGDRDWFRVSVTAGVLLTIELRGSDSGTGTLSDPYLYWYDSNGQLVGERNDSGTVLDSKLLIVPNTSGVLYFAAGAYGDSYAGTYRLTITSGDEPVDDYADSFANRSRPFGHVEVGHEHFARLGTRGDRDWFEVQLTAGVNYVLDFKSADGLGSLPDPYLRLHDPKGALITENNDVQPGVNASSLLTFRPTVTGTYYLEAGAFNDTGTGYYYMGAHLAPNIAPVVTIPSADVPATARQVFTADSLFSIADADNDPLTYFLYDGTLGGGHFMVNGVAVADQTVVALSAVQIAQTVFVTGAPGSSDDLAVMASDGHDYSGNTSFSHFNVNVSGRPAVNDFNGDGKSDIVWRNDAGVAAIWDMNDGTILRGNSLGAVPLNWKIAGTGDFNGDGMSDLLWRNDAGGVAIWDMNDGTVLRGHSLGAVPANWHIAGTGDFNGDHMSDIVWRNDAGVVAIWDMNDGVILRGNSLGLVPDNWHIAGTNGDFNGDGKSDLLWRNDAGAAIWEMNDGTVLRGHSLGAVPANWHIAGTGDFNGDHMSDILWRNDAGTVAIWNMNDGTVLSGNSPGSMPADWHIANTGDYNGDGKSDILWRNDAGATAIWDIDDGAILHANSLGSVPTNWHIIA